MIFSLLVMVLAASAFGQQSAAANSVWNGGEGPWNTPVDWTTNGLLAATTPNNGDTVLCSVGGVLEPCTGYFNVTIGTGAFDLATLDSLPVTIDSLALGASTGSAALDIGSSVADGLTIGDPAAPNGGATASLTVNSTGELNVFAGSKLDLNISAGNGTVTNNGAINLEAGSGTGSSLLVNDAGNTHTLTLQGTGRLTLQPGSAIQGVRGDETLINSSAIQGAGAIENLALVNQGAVIANGNSTLNINSVGKGSETGFTNSGTIEVESGSTLKTVLTAGASGTGLSNSGNISIANAGTFTACLSNTTGGMGFSNSGTVNVNDGGTLLLQDLNHGTTATLNNFQGNINVGQSTGATVVLNDGGQGATFNLIATNGSTGLGTVTLVNSTIKGMSGDEKLVNGFNNTIEGSGLITNLTLDNSNGEIVANGGTLKINATLTNLNNGTLTGGLYAAGDTAPGTLLLPGDVTTNSAGLELSGNGSEITDPAGKNALAGLTTNVNGTLNVANGASLAIAGNFNNVNSTGNSNIDSVVIVSNGATLTIAGGLTNSGAVETGLTVGGSTISVGGTLTNNNEVNLSLSGDELNVGAFKNAASVFVTTGATLTVASGGSYAQTAGKTGVNGTLVSPVVSITGGVVTTAGKLETGKLTNLASITASFTGFIGVGSGTFTATHGYQELANGTLDELISSKSAFGLINVTGAAALNGALDVTLEDGFVPTVGEQFAFMDFTKGDLTGTFADFAGQTFDNGTEQWSVSYNNAAGELLLTAESSPT